MESRRPPPYPEPITSPEQREAAREIHKELRELTHPLLRSKIPMDGAVGLAAIALLACMALAMNLSIILAPGFPENASSLWSFLALNGLCIGGIFLGIMRRRAHRRIRRLSEGKCPRCGYSLEGITSDKCPECGSPAVRMNIDADKLL